MQIRKFSFLELGTSHNSYTDTTDREIHEEVYFVPIGQFKDNSDEVCMYISVFASTTGNKTD